MNERTPVDELDEVVIELLCEHGPATPDDLTRRLLDRGHHVAEPALYQSLDRLRWRTRVNLTLAGAVFAIDRRPR